MVRHGSNDYLPKALAGRLPGIHLNQQGRADAERAAARLQSFPIDMIISSPMERCRETAEPLARVRNLPVELADAFNEVDFGEWKGAALTTIAEDQRWSHWNTFRTGHVIPGGETMVQIQSRIASEMIRLANVHTGRHIALYSHGDPIRAALCYWLGMPLDFLLRLQVDPGSVSIIRIDHATAVVSGVNLL